jgi:hypothetical protein
MFTASLIIFLLPSLFSEGDFVSGELMGAENGKLLQESLALWGSAKEILPNLDKGTLRLYENLTREESTALLQLRTGKIGFRLPCQ